jgi:hypothetical protein
MWPLILLGMHFGVAPGAEACGMPYLPSTVRSYFPSHDNSSVGKCLTASQDAVKKMPKLSGFGSMSFTSTGNSSKEVWKIF